MTLVLRSVKGANLTPAEVDGNFTYINDRVSDLESNPASAISISSIDVSNNILTITLTDASVHTFTLNTTLNINFRGLWTALTPYYVGDIIYYNGIVYIVMLAHTSDTIFDPYANDGSASDFYSKLLEQPTMSIPVGGLTGYSLRKYSDDDYAMEWAPDLLSELFDVNIPTPVAGDVLSFNGDEWVNTPRLGAFSLSDLSDVDIANTAAGDGDLLSITDGVWDAVPRQDLLAFSNLTGTASPAQIRQSTVTALGASGTVSIDPTLGEVYSVTPTNNITLNATSAPAGARITIVVTTSGTSSYNITFNSSFKSTGVLATGTVSAKIFTISFISNGSNLCETSRTTAM